MQQWNAAVQRELPGQQTLTVAYVGSKGTHLSQSVNLNQAMPGDGSVASRRRWPQHATVNLFQSAGVSSYHSLQATLAKRFAQGVSYNLGYTYSHYLDMGSQGGNGASPISLISIANQSIYKGNAEQDLRHQFRGTFQYELPFGPGKRYLSQGEQRCARGLDAQRRHLDVHWHSLHGDRAQYAQHWRRELGGPDGQRDSTEQRAYLARWFDDGAFNNPGFRMWGNGGRNTLFGPGTNQWDFSVFKNFQVRETMRLQFRTEMFNAFNTPQFNNPASAIGSTNTGRISSAGSETTLQRTQRQVQFALKLIF
ncbi:MAG: hypothetical protein R2724_02335 [Bryobacterales bacterium]